MHNQHVCSSLRTIALACASLLALLVLLLAAGSARADILRLGNWVQRASGNSPAARSGQTAVWTGSEMIVWGGDTGSSDFNDGARYNPAANAWTPLPATGAPAARTGHTAVWTGSEMVVWGGYNDSTYLYSNDGARYNPTANTWTALPTTGAPSARGWHTAVWTGSEMIVWGGYGVAGYSSAGASYDPAANTWTPLPTNSAPAGRFHHTAVWTGSEMIVWGGGYWYSGWLNFNDGGRYDPLSNSWTPVTTNGAAAARFHHTAVWTGSEMIVWGGQGNGNLKDGGRYNPAANSWTAVPTSGAPSTRENHTAVWSGSEMIVWGGTGSSYFSDGGLYDPAANSWTPISSSGPAAARMSHTSVWTGSEMILFGGYGSSGYLSDTWSYYPYAPTVRISRSNPASALVAWPVWSSTLRLSQSTNLASGPWTTVTNAVFQAGSENHVSVSPLSGGQFFRAEYP